MVETIFGPAICDKPFPKIFSAGFSLDSFAGSCFFVSSSESVFNPASALGFSNAFSFALTESMVFVSSGFPSFSVREPGSSFFSESGSDSGTATSFGSGLSSFDSGTGSIPGATEAVSPVFSSFSTGFDSPAVFTTGRPGSSTWGLSALTEFSTVSAPSASFSNETSTCKGFSSSAP